MASSKTQRKPDTLVKETQEFINATSEYAPVMMKPYVKIVSPYLAILWVKFIQFSPYIITAASKGIEIWSVLPKDILLAIYGFALCFFGAHYALTIAAVEAFRISGWDTFSASLTSVWQSCLAVHDAYLEEQKTNKASEQLSVQEKAQKMILVVFKAVDPHKLHSSLVSLYTGALAVLATLRFETVKKMALGTSVSTQLLGVVNKSALAPLKVFCEQYNIDKSWAPKITEYFCKSIGVTVAFYSYQALTGVNSALYGGRMCVLSLVRFGNKSGLFEKQFGKKFNPEDSYLDEALGWSLSLIGLWFQLKMAFGLPFLLSLVLFPVSMLEYSLAYLVF
eukprot:m.98362 g.98362  ORF g.98362 m.98362 type:complete len:336 (-) comp27058_c0_seq1:459-1466(-)